MGSCRGPLLSPIESQVSPQVLLYHLPPSHDMAAPPGPFVKVISHLGHAFPSCCPTPRPAGPQHREAGSEVLPDSDCVIGLVQKLAALVVEHPYVAGTGCKCGK